MTQLEKIISNERILFAMKIATASGFLGSHGCFLGCFRLENLELSSDGAGLSAFLVVVVSVATILLVQKSQEIQVWV